MDMVTSSLGTDKTLGVLLLCLRLWIVYIGLSVYSP